MFALYNPSIEDGRKYRLKHRENLYYIQIKYFGLWMYIRIGAYFRWELSPIYSDYCTCGYPTREEAEYYILVVFRGKLVE